MPESELNWDWEDDMFLAEFQERIERADKEEMVLILAKTMRVLTNLLDERNRRVQDLEALISEHHAIGALTNIHVGGRCPVCQRAAPEDQGPG